MSRLLGSFCGIFYFGYSRARSYRHRAITSDSDGDVFKKVKVPSFTTFAKFKKDVKEIVRTKGYEERMR